MIMTKKLGLTIVAAALIAIAGCGKEEPKKAAEAPKAPVEDTVTVKIGHAGPLTGGIAHLGKDNENGVRLALDEANAKDIKHRRQEGQVRADGRRRPGGSEARTDDCPEIRGREGRRRGRPPEFRRDDSGVGRLQPGRHPRDFRLGDQPQADRAGLQERVPRGRPR